MRPAWDGKAITDLVLYRERDWLGRLDVWPFAPGYAALVTAARRFGWSPLALGLALGALLTLHVLTWLGEHWSVRFRAWVTLCRARSVERATQALVVPRPHHGPSEIVPLQRQRSQDGERFIEFQKRRYEYSADASCFRTVGGGGGRAARAVRPQPTAHSGTALLGAVQRADHGTVLRVSNILYGAVVPGRDVEVLAVDNGHVVAVRGHRGVDAPAHAARAAGYARSAGGHAGVSGEKVATRQLGGVGAGRCDLVDGDIGRDGGAVRYAVARWQCHCERGRTDRGVGAAHQGRAAGDAGGRKRSRRRRSGIGTTGCRQATRSVQRHQPLAAHCACASRPVAAIGAGRWLRRLCFAHRLRFVARQADADHDALHRELHRQQPGEPPLHPLPVDVCADRLRLCAAHRTAGPQLVALRAVAALHSDHHLGRAAGSAIAVVASGAVGAGRAGQTGHFLHRAVSYPAGRHGRCVLLRQDWHTHLRRHAVCRGGFAGRRCPVGRARSGTAAGQSGGGGLPLAGAAAGSGRWRPAGGVCAECQPVDVLAQRHRGMSSRLASGPQCSHRAATRVCRGSAAYERHRRRRRQQQHHHATVLRAGQGLSGSRAPSAARRARPLRPHLPAFVATGNAGAGHGHQDVPVGHAPGRADAPAAHCRRVRAGVRRLSGVSVSATAGFAAGGQNAAQRELSRGGDHRRWRSHRQLRGASHRYLPASQARSDSGGGARGVGCSDAFLLGQADAVRRRRCGRRATFSCAGATAAGVGAQPGGVWDGAGGSACCRSRPCGAAAALAGVCAHDALAERGCVDASEGSRSARAHVWRRHQRCGCAEAGTRRSGVAAAGTETVTGASAGWSAGAC
eukprot:ctg_166.g95